jgi:hypothetical protein
LRTAGGFFRNHVQHKLFSAAQNGQSGFDAYLFFRQKPMQIVNA